jgi:ribosomal protein L34
VDERSACLDCSKALPLPKDHINLNKYTGRDDNSFQLVCGQIRGMAYLAPNLNLYPDRQKWLADLQQSNPLDDLVPSKEPKKELQTHAHGFLARKNMRRGSKVKTQRYSA